MAPLGSGFRVGFASADLLLDKTPRRVGARQVLRVIRLKRLDTVAGLLGSKPRVSL